MTKTPLSCKRSCPFASFSSIAFSKVKDPSQLSKWLETTIRRRTLTPRTWKLALHIVLETCFKTKHNWCLSKQKTTYKPPLFFQRNTRIGLQLIAINPTSIVFDPSLHLLHRNLAALESTHSYTERLNWRPPTTLKWGRPIQEINQKN